MVGQSEIRGRSQRVCLASAEPVIHGELKLRFIDGYEAVVDLRQLIAKGRIWTWLRGQENFANILSRVGVKC